MDAPATLDRRAALKGLAGAAGFVLAVSLGARPSLAKLAVADFSDMPEGVLEPSVYLSIARDGTAHIICHRSEMGQGIRTGLPQCLADELEADWARVKVVQALGDEAYGSQFTDGSRSIRRFITAFRTAGAAARLMLERAAADRWGVPAAECAAANHRVVHEPSGRALDFADLVDAAAALPVPDDDALSFKSPDQYRYMGRDLAIVDLDDMVHGRAQFGIDVRVPGMLYAVVAHPPVLYGRVRAVDASATLAVPGVRRVVELPAMTEGPPGFMPLGGVAVVADNTWAAIKGREALRVDWDHGANAAWSSDSYRRDLEQTVRATGQLKRQRGDVDAAFGSAAQVVEAEYYTPLLAQTPMEPPAALAHVRDGRVEVWTCTQDPQAAQDTVARFLGLEKQDVDVHVTLLGGAFGRKSKPDYVAEAAWVSREVGAPVKLTWTREDDVRHSFFHSCAAQYLKGAVDGDGRATAWLHRTAFPSIGATFQAGVDAPSAGEMRLGFVDLPFATPNLRLEAGRAPVHTRIGWLRSVCNIFHQFAIGSFVGELAHASGRDARDMLLEMIGPPRIVDLAAEGAEYDNYGDPIEQYPIDTGRLRAVVEVVADKAGWGRTLPAGHGQGIFGQRSFLSYTAAVVQVAVSEAGELTIPRVDIAIDSGIVVNPDRVRAQMEGSVIYALSGALEGQLTARDGAIEQGNFDDYLVARMSDAPLETHVHLVPSGDLPGGVGEPGVPPIAPALCNAIFDATGKRIRALPIADQLRT